MNRSQKKTLFVLLGILLLLAVILVAIFAIRQSRAQAEEEEEAAREAASVITAQEAVYTDISYDNGSTSLSFHQEEDGTWVWADDPEFPLDDSTITSIVDLLTNLKPQQTITDGDTLEAYGLDQPVASLTATESNGQTLTIALGNTTTDGNSYYMLMNGDESTVYIIADTLYTYMSETIYSMMDLPDLPSLTEENIQSVSIEGAVSTLLRPIAEDDTVSWVAGGEDVTDAEDTASLLTELEYLSLDACVDFKPTEDAVSLCGFDTPLAVVTILYLSDTGAEETLTLTFGSENLDSTGYYVRLADDTTIYQMNTDGVDTLLAVAENGLSASSS